MDGKNLGWGWDRQARPQLWAIEAPRAIDVIQHPAEAKRNVGCRNPTDLPSG